MGSPRSSTRRLSSNALCKEFRGDNATHIFPTSMWRRRNMFRIFVDRGPTPSSQHLMLDFNKNRLSSLVHTKRNKTVNPALFVLMVNEPGGDGIFEAGGVYKTPLNTCPARNLDTRKQLRNPRLAQRRTPLHRQNKDFDQNLLLASTRNPATHVETERTPKRRNRQQKRTEPSVCTTCTSSQ